MKLISISNAFYLAIIATATAALTNDIFLVPDLLGHFFLVSNSNVIRVGKIDVDSNANITFIVYSQKNNEGVNVTYGNKTSLRTSGFNPKHPTRFTIHGWLNDATSLINIVALDGFIKNGGPFNVVVVDWSIISKTPDYIAAFSSIGKVGAQIAHFANWLNKLGSPWKNMNFVGHSLGGHVAGIAGKNTKSKVNSIIACDPAGPLFKVDVPEYRVSRGDAEYVEIIHTNGCTLGFSDPIGDADFYVNFGTIQPGCGCDISGTCSHFRAVQFWGESLLNDNFWAVSCSNFLEISSDTCQLSATARMGGEPSNRGKNVTGIYYLKTADAPPFALGQQSIANDMFELSNNFTCQLILN